MDSSSCCCKLSNQISVLFYEWLRTLFYVHKYNNFWKDFFFICSFTSLLACWLDGCTAGWLAGWLTDWLTGWLAEFDRFAYYHLVSSWWWTTLLFCLYVCNCKIDKILQWQFCLCFFFILFFFVYFFKTKLKTIHHFYYFSPIIYLRSY